MNLLFYFYGTRVWYDEQGDLYASGNFPQRVWDRYLNLCDELYVLMRLSKDVLTTEYAEKSCHKIDTNRINMVLLPDIYASKNNYMNVSLHKELNDKMKFAISKCDAAIVRSADSTIIKKIRKNGMPYLIEVVGCPWDAYWNHSISGKVMAPYKYLEAKREINRAPWVLYVTDVFLQKRYPTKGVSVGCSDVYISDNLRESLELRKQRIRNERKTIVLGTIGGVGVKYKGHKYVIDVMKRLKDRGINNYIYEIVGGGDNSYLKKYAYDNGLQDEVKFVGQLSHDKVFLWLQNIDIYIQPSLQEGLPRSIIEAMSLSVPCIGSDAGGIPELLDDKMIFRKKKVSELENILLSLDKSKLCEQAARNYENSKQYSFSYLNNKREMFYSKFISSVNNI